MDYLASIRNAFEAKGYERFEFVAPIPGDIWFKHVLSNSVVEHVLCLSYKPTAKAYSVHVGAFNADARNAVVQKLPQLERFIEPDYLASPFLMERPCWQIFDAGRALRWESIFVIPSPRNPDSWPHQFNLLFTDFIEKFFFCIRDCKGIIELLLRNDAPFEWFMSNPVLRISEIAALGKIAGEEPDFLMGRINVFKEIILRRLPLGNYKDTIDGIFQELY
jgi:hypothetical protein